MHSPPFGSDVPKRFTIRRAGEEGRDATVKVKMVLLGATLAVVMTARNGAAQSGAFRYQGTSEPEAHNKPHVAKPFVLDRPMVLNNVTAQTGEPDLEVAIDPNLDSLIALNTNDPDNGAWGLQATTSTFGSEFEIVSKKFEPFFCWGASWVGPWYQGTCGYQQPINGDAPFHFIRNSDENPHGMVVDVETLGSGTPLWGVDANGNESAQSISAASINIRAADGTMTSLADYVRQECGIVAGP